MPSTIPAARRQPATLVAWRLVPTPMGPFVIAVDELGRLSTGWQRADWPARRRHAVAQRARPELLHDLATRFERYFAGRAANFDDVPGPDGTEFQQACWTEARAVPRGETISYAELARRAGREESAARAAGQCMRCNPLPIIVPCHRILSASGALHGFAGSSDPDGRELALKAWLLRLEGAMKPSASRAPR